MRAKKSLGQNFLMHARIAERIALVAGLTEESTVLEIGPGTGMLTRELLKLSKHIIAVEADGELFTKLQDEFAKEIADEQLTLLHTDIRTFELSTLPKKYSLVANIPYYLTGDIFRKFLETEYQPQSMTLLVQKEVADRIVARGKESILSLSVKVYGVPKREFLVPRGAFIPAPNVDSAVLTIRGISRQHFSNTTEEELFFKLIQAGFAHKRKFVRSNLAEKGFQAGNISEKARAEDLALSDWLQLIKLH
jgi:16S rRNA (adenine1518-N6/adenine1519-N6)-dimethyltransferase